MQINTATNTVNAYHNAIDKLFKSVHDKGHSVHQMSNINLTRRNNRQSGEHVHASCSIKIRFDESVLTEPDADKFA